MADGRLETAEAVLIDGANAVDGAPRAQFPHATVGLVVCAAVLVLGLVVRRRPTVLLGLALVAALPGWGVVLLSRADAPTRRPALARAIVSAVQAVEAVAPWPDGGVQLGKDNDDVLSPISRYALPTRPTVDPPRVQLELMSESLLVRCVDAGPSAVRCEARP